MAITGKNAIPLTGADCFLRAFDAEVRRTAGASHNSQLILRLGPGFDLAAFRELMGAVVRANPILHAPIERPFWLSPPVYSCASARPEHVPQVEVHDRSGAPGEIPALFFERLNGRFDGRRGRLVHFDIVSYDGGRQGTDLAMSWLHMLFDGAGCEWFVRWLDQCARGQRGPAELPADEGAAAPGLPQGIPSGERGRRAMSWQHGMNAVAERPVRSLAGPLRRVTQDLRYDVTTLSPNEASGVLRRAADASGFLTPMVFHLACAIRAHHAVYRARGLDPSSYVIPLPVDLRPKGPEKALFRTRVSLIWFRVSPELVDDFGALLADLKRQRHLAIEQHRVEDGAIAMDFARHAPTRVYTYMARRSLRGELCSFFFAYTGEFAGDLRQFMGSEIRNAFTAPSVPASPGSALTISRFGDRMNLLHVHQRGVFSKPEQELFAQQLRGDLLGEG